MGTPSAHRFTPSSSARLLSPAPAPLLLALFVMLVLPGTTSAGSSYDGPTLRARQRAVKPARSSVPAGYDRSLIVVKFQDGLDLVLDASGVPGSPTGDFFRSERARNTLRNARELGGIWRRASGMDRHVLETLRSRAQLALGREIADLTSYFTLRLPPRADPVVVMDALNGLAEVELASPAPLSDTHPSVPDFEPLQGYLSESPGGLDARFAWSIPGGTGTGVSIVDIEGGWNLQHEDLPPATVLIPEGETATLWVDDHGTEVLGTMFSLPNGWGTTGAAHGAGCFVAPVHLDSGYGLFQQILWAASQLDAGDVILIERAMIGPYYRWDGTQFGTLPVEWDPALFNAILIAVGNGIHVVEPAGNGYQNLDDPLYVQGNHGHAPFTPENNSGAIMVGAGIPPTAPELGPDRSRSSFSNFGSRLDVQAWGHRVATTGAGDLFSEEGPNRTFTRFFGGTSSAGPLVAAAAASIEGIVQHATGSTVSPAIMRSLLRDTGIPQQDGSRAASSEPIGPRPDLRAAIQRMARPLVSSPPTLRGFSGETLRAVVYAADLDGEPLASLSASSLPYGAAFTVWADHTRGELEWTPESGQEGTYAVVFTASNHDAASDTTWIAIEDADRGPRITGPASEVTFEDYAPLRVTLHAIDPNGDPILRFEATDLPRGASFTADSMNTVGTFLWSPDYDQAGTYLLSFTAVSSSAVGPERAATALLSVRVLNVDRAPEIQAPSRVDGTEGEPLSFTITAADPDGDAIAVLRAEDLPVGALFEVGASNSSALVTWTPDFGQDGSHLVRFRAENQRFTYVGTFLRIANHDRPPVIEAPEMARGVEGAEMAFDITGTDPDGEAVGIAAVTGPEGSGLAVFSPGVARFSWVPRFGDAGRHTATFRASSGPPFEPVQTDSIAVDLVVEGGRFEADISIAPGEETIRLVTGRPRTCVQLEAVDGAFDIAAVDPGTVYARALTATRVQPIPEMPVHGDRDQDGLTDILLCFSKEDLRQLFADEAVDRHAELQLSGDLPNGGGFQGSIGVDVVLERGLESAKISGNPSRTPPVLSFRTNLQGSVRLRVFDVKGALVHTALDEREVAPGFHDIALGRKAELPSGVYYFRLETPEGRASGKFVLLK